MASSAHKSEHDVGKMHVIQCPTCANETVYHPSNPFRPFCSETCRQIDFGAWASEEYAVPTAPIDRHEPDAQD